MIFRLNHHGGYFGVLNSKPLFVSADVKGFILERLRASVCNPRHLQLSEVATGKLGVLCVKWYTLLKIKANGCFDSCYLGLGIFPWVLQELKSDQKQVDALRAEIKRLL